jgi:flagellar assembly protein FliH
MSSTSSRVLRIEEHSDVQPIWWRDIAITDATRASSDEPAAMSEPEAAEHNRELEQERELERQREWERQREQGERAAYQRGLNEGKAAGREQAAGEVQPVLDRLAHTLADLSSLRSRIRKDAEGDLVKLSISVARRVLHRELTLDPESIEGLIRVALEKLQSRELCRVRVHPDQEPAIRASLARFSNSQNVELIPDASMQCGTVVLETAHGTLDASIEAQLREIERGFADRLGR